MRETGQLIALAGEKDYHVGIPKYPGTFCTAYLSTGQHLPLLLLSGAVLSHFTHMLCFCLFVSLDIFHCLFCCSFCPASLLLGNRSLQRNLAVRICAVVCRSRKDQPLLSKVTGSSEPFAAALLMEAGAKGPGSPQ